jgi:hypothetical protein
VRYLLLFPLWGDEAALVVNFLDRDFAGLTRQLEGNQVAPLFFLWGEKAVILLLGSSEAALRFLPLLAGLLSLFLFWRLARLVLGPAGVLAAVGLLALARWPVTMACTVKPYGFDLLAALALLLPAVHVLRLEGTSGTRGTSGTDPEARQGRWLLGLTLLAPLTLLCSWPAVFVAGGVSLALAGPVLRSSRRTLSLFVAFNLAIAVTFLANWFFVARQQLDPEVGSVQTFMLNYWADGFPPGHPLALLRWLALIHTGRMMAYPVGDANGGSVATFLLFLTGVMVFLRRRSLLPAGESLPAGSLPGSFLLLWLAPFGLNLLAAALHRYPYGGCCRLSQHLAPAVCLLAGAGLARLADGLPPAWRFLLTRVWFGLLVLLGVGQMIVDIAQPWRDAETRWFAQTARTIREHAAPGEQIVVAQRREQAESMFRYHLGRQGGVEWGAPLPSHPPTCPESSIWYVDLQVEPEPLGGTLPLRAADPDLPPGWTVQETTRYDLPPIRSGHPWRRCTLFLIPHPSSLIPPDEAP